jgi:hypothetical protein
LQKAELQGGQPKSGLGSCARGAQEIREEFEQTWQGGVAFGDSFEEARCIGGLFERGVVMTEAVERLKEADFPERMEGAASAGVEGELSEVVQVESASEGRFGSEGATSQRGDASQIGCKPADDEAGFREPMGS